MLKGFVGHVLINAPSVHLVPIARLVRWVFTSSPTANPAYKSAGTASDSEQSVMMETPTMGMAAHRIAKSRWVSSAKEDPTPALTPAKRYPSSSRGPTSK